MVAGFGSTLGQRWQPAEAKRSEDWNMAATALFKEPSSRQPVSKAASRSACRRNPNSPSAKDILNTRQSQTVSGWSSKLAGRFGRR